MRCAAPARGRRLAPPLLPAAAGAIPCGGKDGIKRIISAVAASASTTGRTKIACRPNRSPMKPPAIGPIRLPMRVTPPVVASARPRNCGEAARAHPGQARQHPRAVAAADAQQQRRERRRCCDQSGARAAARQRHAGGGLEPLLAEARAGHADRHGDEHAAKAVQGKGGARAGEPRAELHRQQRDEREYRGDAGRLQQHRQEYRQHQPAQGGPARNGLRAFGAQRRTSSAFIRCRASSTAAAVWSICSSVWTALTMNAPPSASTPRLSRARLNGSP